MKIGLKQLIDPKIRRLSKESAQFYADRIATSGNKKQPDLRTAAGLKEAREVRTAGITANHKVVERRITAHGLSVSIRIARPDQRKLRGVFLIIPGGGFYLDESVRSDDQNVALAEVLGIAVVGVQYRLAPEHPWPAAPDDCEIAGEWLIKHAGSMFGTDNLLIGGASAGANLAMITLLRLRENHRKLPLIGSVLQFGAYDLSGQTPGGRLYADEYFIGAYAGNAPDKTDPDISPLFGDLSNLPPTLMIVGTSDILMEDNFAMASRLSAAGNDIDLRVYPDAPHGFTSQPTKLGKMANQEMIEWLMRRLDETP